MERDTSPAIQEKEAPKQPPWWKRFWEWTAFGEKSGWQWLELFVVSLALAVLGVWFTNSQEERQQLSEQQRAKAELALEAQRAENAALQAYLDQMSQLMLDENLRTAEAGSDAHLLARARTLTVLSEMEASPSEDETSKEQVVEFLIEAKLVHPGNGEGPVISLEETHLGGVDLDEEDLHGVNLRNAIMRDANLEGANLEAANLESAKLRGANLKGANLYGAELKNAWLEGANLAGATMPNGQKYEDWLRSQDRRDDEANGGPQ
jgi:Tfp pilus assembly protein PilE